MTQIIVITQNKYNKYSQRNERILETKKNQIVINNKLKLYGMKEILFKNKEHSGLA